MGSDGAYSAADVQRMTAEKRRWTILRIDRLLKDREKAGRTGR